MLAWPNKPIQQGFFMRRACEDRRCNLISFQHDPIIYRRHGHVGKGGDSDGWNQNNLYIYLTDKD